MNRWQNLAVVTTRLVTIVMLRVRNVCWKIESSAQVSSACNNSESAVALWLPELGKTAADFSRICVHDGARFTLVDGDKTYLLEGDLNVLQRIAGQRAVIVGVVAGNAIRVSSLSPAK